MPMSENTKLSQNNIIVREEGQKLLHNLAIYVTF